jgi:tetratricopeptide (TPR) repeat protein
MAFGADVQRIPAPETFGVSRDLPPDPNLERTFLDRYLEVPVPFSAPATDTALTYIDLQLAVLSKARNDSAIAYGQASFAASIGMLIGHPGLPPILGPTDTLSAPLPNNMVLQIVFRMAQTHSLPAACNLLAVREAQRGVLARPNSGRAHLVLALAYSQLPPVGTNARPWQLTVAGHQALARLTPEQRNSREIGSLVTTVLIAMFHEHVQRHELDLALECIEQALDQYERFPPIFRTTDQHSREMPQLQKDMDRLKKDVNDNLEKYLLELAKVQRQNAPLRDQVQLARNFGLVREAMKLLNEALQNEKIDLSSLPQLVSAYLSLGQPEDAQPRLDEVPDQFRSQFDVYQMRVWIAMGDYDRAGKMLERQIATLEKELNQKVNFQSLAVGLMQLHFSSAEMAAQITRLATTRPGMETLLQVIVQNNQLDQRFADLHASRGMLALEQGDLDTADRYFKSALDFQIRFTGDIYCHVYRRALEKQHGKTK